MNYYFDSEFVEDFITARQGIFGKERTFHYVSLISIGLVSEDGREYYAVSKDFDLKHVWNKHDLKLGEMGDAPIKVYWLRENVLRPIWEDLRKNVSGFAKDHTTAHDSFTYKNLKTLIEWYGKTNEEIAKDIQCFTAGLFSTKDMEETRIQDVCNFHNKNNPPTFYAYYADYDWVVFCSLFGRMLDLPAGYPMYCKDLKQMMDQFGLGKEWKDKYVPGDNEHHALADARWDRRLHAEIERHIRLQQYPTMLDKSKDVS